MSVSGGSNGSGPAGRTRQEQVTGAEGEVERKLERRQGVMLRRGTGRPGPQTRRSYQGQVLWRGEQLGRLDTPDQGAPGPHAQGLFSLVLSPPEQASREERLLLNLPERYLQCQRPGATVDMGQSPSVAGVGHPHHLCPFTAQEGTSLLGPRPPLPPPAMLPARGGSYSEQETRPSCTAASYRPGAACHLPSDPNNLGCSKPALCSPV